MFSDDPSEWSMPEGAQVGPPTTIEDLRDSALNMFDRYMADRLKVKTPKLTEKLKEHRRKFLTISETESIVREFHQKTMPDGTCLPEGMYTIHATSLEELRQKVNEVIAALMMRIMSNVVNEGVNLGLLECAFDSEHDAFAFSVSDRGEKIIKKLQKERKKKKKKDDSDN